jgi:hypothetical protein
MQMMFRKTSKNYLLPIKQVQAYYEELEASYMKRRNPFKMLSPVLLPSIVEMD